MPQSQDLKRQFVDRHNDGHRAIKEAYRALDDDTDRDEVIKVRRRLFETEAQFRAAADLFREGNFENAMATLPPRKDIRDLVAEADSLLMKERVVNPDDASDTHAGAGQSVEPHKDEANFIKQPDKSVIPSSDKDGELPAKQEKNAPQSNNEEVSDMEGVPSNADILNAVQELKGSSLPDGYRQVLEEFSPEDLEAVLKVGRWANQRRGKRQSRRGKYAADASY